MEYVFDYLLSKKYDNPPEQTDIHTQNTRVRDCLKDGVICKLCSETVFSSPSHVEKEYLYGEVHKTAEEFDNSNWLTIQQCPNCATSAALKFHGEWFTIEDCLQTRQILSNGLRQVRTYAERVVLYILSQILFQEEDMEKGSKQVTFLCPGPDEFAKIIWIEGQAVGFYTMKLKGSPYTGCSYDFYQMPVIDLMYVRKTMRRKGLATMIVSDVVQMFPKENIGLSEPVSDNMLKVVAKFLEVYPEWRDYLWEISWTGAEGFRNNLWLLIRRLRKEKKLK